MEHRAATATGSATDANSAPRRARAVLIGSLLLPLLVLLIYWPGLGGGFVFDDYPNIVDNVALHVTHPVWREWLAAIFSSPASDLQRPLSMLSFAANHYFTGLDPWPMKLTSLLVHALNSLLVFALARRVLAAVSQSSPNESRGTDWIALFASACWALHPINLIAVLFIVQRMELLGHSFVFLGLWLYITGRQRQIAGIDSWRRILFGLIGCTCLGLFAKESAALLPVYAFALELCLFRFRGAGQTPDRRLRWLYVAVLLVPAIAAVAWLLPRALTPGAYATRDFTLVERLMTEPRVVLDYLHWILLPDLGHLSLYHDDYVVSRGLWTPASTAFALLAVPLLLAFAWWARTRRPLLSLGLFWFLGAQLLTATFIPLELVFEHRNYFASLGICLVLADVLLLLPRQEKHRHIGALFAVLLLLFYSGITHLRAREWDSPAHFSASEAAKHPNSPRATYDLARTLIILGNYQLDSPYTKQAFVALEQARRVPRSGILPDQAALMLAARTGTPLQPEWWQEMQWRLRHNAIGPQEIASIASLANCAIDKLCDFPVDDMIATFTAALDQAPRSDVLNIYGNYTLNILDDPELTLQIWRKAAELRPKEAQYPANLAKLYIALGRFDEARAQIAKVRGIGRLGQNEASAQALEKRLAKYEAAPPPPKRH